MDMDSQQLTLLTYTYLYLNLNYLTCLFSVVTAGLAMAISKSSIVYALGCVAFLVAPAAAVQRLFLGRMDCKFSCVVRGHRILGETTTATPTPTTQSIVSHFLQI